MLYKVTVRISLGDALKNNVLLAAEHLHPIRGIL
jgi:hypothetical protein